MNARSHPVAPDTSSVVARLSALAPLNGSELEALEMATRSRRNVSAHHDLIEEGSPVAEPAILLSGWVGRSRIFPDGRRQILSLLVPGDLIGVCRQRNPIAATGMVALTPVVLCPAPSPEPGSGLAEAYAQSGAIEEFHLFRQIARLGRLSAYERMTDLLLELCTRLSAVNLGAPDQFPMPLTQEVLADLLGLTSVHVNRTLQTLRREGLLELRSGVARLKDAERLGELVDYRPARVSAI
jgi:CRP-like cAMP-binding protein